MTYRCVIAVAAFVAACQPVGSRLCAPCDLDTCTGELRCLQNVCVPPDAPDFCPNYVPPPSCGDGPPCGEGLECFEGVCEAPLDVQVGWAHACALWRSGSVACWGANGAGEAGGLDEQFAPSAVRVSNLAEVAEIAVGIGFSCARREDGEVFCWGDNYLGELGNFGAGGPAPHSGPIPQKVALPGPAKRIYAAEHSGCALLEDDSLACWGWNGHGCLRVNNSYSTLPVTIANDVSERLVVGETHVVWIEDGRLVGLGSNGSGQLGVPSTCEPTDLGFENVTHVAAGAIYTCVVQDRRQVRCFGTFEGIASYDHPIPIERIVAARKNTCITDVDRNTFCWGPDTTGIVGTLDYYNVPSGPSEPVPVAFANDAKVSIGNNFACLVRARDGAYCWGRPDWGFIGNGRGPIIGPEVVTSEKFVELDSGSGHTCGRTEDGRVECWGANDNGALGRGRLGPTEDTAPLEGVDATKLACGGGVTCVIDPLQRLFCTGRLFRTLTVVDSTELQRVGGLPPVRDVAIGWETMCVLAVDGDVYCFGDNRNGQAVPSATSTEYFATPQRVPEATGAVEIAIGSGTTCARFADDRVVCWGDLGPQGGPAELALPDGSIVPGVEELRVGVGNVLLRTSDGKVKAGGFNEGRLGNGQAARPVGLVDVLGAEDAARIFAYGYHACILKRDGALDCWGGAPVRPDRLRAELAPVPFGAELAPFDLVSTGNFLTCAQRTAGDVVCWGDGARIGAAHATTLPAERVVGLVGRGPAD